MSDSEILLRARILELEQQLAVQETEAAYYRRLAKQAGEARLREIEEYSRLVTQLKEQLKITSEQHHELATLNLEIERISVTDELTGLLNRRGLMSQFMRRFKTDQRSIAEDEAAASGFCAMIDVDHFKKINDTYGHLVGDEVLRQMGRLLKGSPHLNETDLVGRYGGEEFLCVLGRDDEATVLIDLAQIIEQIKQHCFAMIDDISLRITVSMGVSAIERHDDSPFNAIDRADRALYQAKQQGRDRIVILERRSGRDRRAH